MRLSLAELEAAEEAARSRRLQTLEQLDALLERAQHGPAELPEVVGGPPVVELPRILIAEDSSTAGKLASRLVERLGDQVILAHDGREAVEMIQADEVAAVLMDCQMSVLDGYEATRQIRRLPGRASSVPIIALTANAMDGDEMRCLAAGMDDYPPKPVDPRQLAESLERWLSPGSSAERKRA